MAYDVSDNYRTIAYSGDATYNCRLAINNILVPAWKIKTIKISSPIIDTTTDSGSMFHIGTFASQTLEIQFKNLIGLNLTDNPEIRLDIGLDVNGDFEYIPIGKFLIDELEENYQETCHITCMDYAIKFRPQLDIHQFFNSSNYILAADLFVCICRYYGVQVGTIPQVNNDKRIYFYDNTISGKQYIMYLAELFGGNAVIERDGSCSIKPLKNYTNIQINALTSKSFKAGNTYELTRVCYDNGRQKYQAGGNVITVDELPTMDIVENAYYYLTTNMKYYIYSDDEWEETTSMKNTLYLRTDNSFITQQADVTNIYNAVKNFSVTNLKCENRADLSLDRWDIVTYNVGNKSYNTFYDNVTTFTGVAMGTVDVNLPLKTKEETTNIITANVASQIRTMRTTINEQEGTIETVFQEVGEQNQKIATLTQSVDELTSQISDISDITVSGESDVAFDLDEVNESEPIMLKIRPTATSISYLYPRENLYPSDTLYMPDRIIRFYNKTTHANIDYILPDDLLYYDSTHYDEFYLDYESKTCQVTKRCKYNADGTIGLLQSTRIDDYSHNGTTYPEIHLTTGNYRISLPGYSNCYVFARLMATNIYTTQFYTRVQTDTKIQQTATNIDLSVNQKLTNYSTTEEVTAAINLSAGQITSSVSDTYETKQDSTQKYNNAKDYTDTNVTTLSSRITQTANAITSEVSRATNAENTLSSRIKQTATGISLTVNNGSTSSGITITTTKEDGTTSSQSGTITMNGLVKFTDLSTTGATLINGNNITTGIIKSSNYEAGVSGTAINLSTGVISSKNFTIFSSGNVSLNGTVTATAGKIAGWTISGTKLVGTANGGNQITIDGDGSITNSNNKWSINRNGTFTATDANISGNITARSGYIGNGSNGWTIGNTAIYNGKSSLTADTNGVYIGTNGISLGTGSTFKVTSSGALTATNATISGNITATSGNIGGCTISNGVLTVKNANIESINGSKITDGTITGGKIGSNTITNGNIYSMGAAKLTSGTVGVDNFVVETNYGFLKCGYGVNHPYVSALNIGYGSGGLSFMSGTSVGNVGNQIGNIFMDTSSGSNVMYLDSGGGINLCYGTLRVIPR